MPLVVLRSATIDDATGILERRNEPSTRAMMVQSLPIALDEHRAWFDKRLSDPNSRIFIAEVPGLRYPEVGHVWFQKRGNSAEISVMVTEWERGHGYGHELIIGGIKLCENWVDSFIAKIKAENHASLSLFAKAGFVTIGGWTEDGSSLVIMERRLHHRSEPKGL